MKIENAMVIIAVSKYNGSYRNLPGTIVSAQRLHKWATQKDVDLNYNVLYLGDDEYPIIDVDLIRKKVNEFIENNFIDRLIVYFAGHGLVRSAGDQFWLLTNADTDPRQGINIESFRRGLLKSNIGQYNDDVPGQLCIISDACRNTSIEGIEFYGDPIFTPKSKRNPSIQRIQLDRFISTGLGDYSFQIDATDGQDAYCLFSEVVLNGLSGKVIDAVETKYHQYRPAVTNHSLADYLDKEVFSRAAEIGEDMIPDLLPSISPPYNYYKLLETPPQSEPKQLHDFLSSITKMSIENHKKANNHVNLRNKIDLIESNIEKFIYSPDYVYDSAFLSDYKPTQIAIPRNSDAELLETDNDDFSMVKTTNLWGNPILVKQESSWIILPQYPNVQVVISQKIPGDVLLYINFNRQWDRYLSDFSNLVHGAPLRASQAREFADNIRIGKEEYPHRSVTAGYLYEFSSDYENIARTAHYMNRTAIVPFDLALLCANKIRWSQEDNGRFKAFADLPAVEEAKDTDNNRPYYAKRSFKEEKNVELWGIAPIFRQGWSFMQTELYLEIPEKIREIGMNMTGRSAAVLNEKQFKKYLRTFEYKIKNFDERERPSLAFATA